VAYPLSASELRERDGYAVMLVSILSQEARELPPTRVFVSFDGKEYALTPITSAVPDLSRGELVERVLGQEMKLVSREFPGFVKAP